MSKRNYSFLALLAGIALSSGPAYAAPALGGLGPSVNAGVNAGVSAGVGIGGVRGGINGGINSGAAPGALPQIPANIPPVGQPSNVVQKTQNVGSDVKAQAMRGYRAVVMAVSGNAVTIKTFSGVTQTFTVANPAALHLKTGQTVEVGMRNGTLIMTHADSSNTANVSAHRNQHKQTSGQLQKATGSQAQQ